MRIIPYRTIDHVIDGVVLTFVDVTDLKHAEEAAHIAQAYAESLVDTIRDPLLVLDATLHVRSANQSFYQIFQVAPAEIQDRLLYTLGSGQWDLPELHQLLGAMHVGNRGFDDFELKCEFPHIGRKTMRLNARKVFTQTTDTELILLAIEDITERKRLEEELACQAAALQRSNGELQQFVHIVSHDLNEPLRTVANFVSMLAKRYQGKLDAEADEYIAFAVDGAKRMQELLKDLLAYTRVGGSTDVFKPVDCEALLTQTLDNLRLAVADSGAEVTHDPLPTVRGDVTLLGQVFQNLIGNALKFRGGAAARAHVSARKENGHWRFAVHDNGIGIAPQHAEQIFQVFQRLHTRREYPGTGIGLAICKKIVERHGGRIWVESLPEQGSTFFFTVSEITKGRGGKNYEL
jgi:signal transduction histidine kinase